MKNSIDILIIDDEQVVIDSVKKVAKLEGYTSDSVQDASMAIYSILNNNYKLIVCDIMMPVMDGFKFLEELKKNNITIPVIMTTGFSTVEYAVQSLSKGAIAFIPKPFTFDEISAIIKRGMNYSALLWNNERLSDSKNILVATPPKFCLLGYSYWAVKEFNGSVLIGVTDLFIKSIGAILNIELFEQDYVLTQGNPAAKLTSDDNYLHIALASLSGKIIERNENLLVQPSLIEKDPYYKGWLYRIIPTDYEYDIKNLVLNNINVIY